MAWVLPAVFGGIGAGVSLWSGYKQGQVADETGRLQREAAYANATDIESLANINAGIINSVAHENAAGYIRVGEANALAIEQATFFNVALQGMETLEDLRRHIYQERMISGSIRAAVGASGVQTNTGTPLHYLMAQQHQGKLERDYVAERGKLTILSTYEMGKTSAAITRLEARERANVEIRNAAAQAEMMSMQSMYEAISLRREGDLYELIGGYNRDAAIWGGISNAFSTGASIYGIMR
jgi:hypothetical protein